MSVKGARYSRKNYKELKNGSTRAGTMGLSLRVSGQILLATTMLLLISFPSLSSFSPEVKRRLPGIWKLTTNCLPYDNSDIKSKLKGLILPPSAKDVASSDGILLKLNTDGTFKQCNEGYKEGRWISGNWKVLQDVAGSNDDDDQHGPRTKLLLAMNRQYYGPQFDVLLEGWIDIDSKNMTMTSPSLRIDGNVRKGKFLHPRTHPAFFDPPFLANSESLGPYRMEQSVAIHSIIGERSDEDNNVDPQTSMLKATKDLVGSDFHGKKFLMTIEPLKKSEKYSQQISDQPVDIRTMPIQFFSNNTFSALGVNKILRGRFQLKKSADSNEGSDELTHELSMQVSLFGAGRSAPGSVYSEGLGLTHEDARTYIGRIQQQHHVRNNNNKIMLYVQGTVFFGTDLGEDARPEPVGRFFLIEDSGSTSSTRKSTTVSDANDLVTSLEDDDDMPYSTTGGIFE